ncbi:MAG: XRE family transcriptional regulator [Ruminococcaceae bacterium]|nr:XRE family transcriptional regulator [Oscillospiraceae bacterium]
MYISYENLWKLLIEKKITKTELMELTGISSRTLSKLSKNETVTTETLLRVCEALDCDIADVMEMRKGEEIKSFWELFKRNAALVEKDDNFTTYRLTVGEDRYLIKKTNKSANKHTIIHCEKGKIIWEQIIPLGISPVRERTVLTGKNFSEKGERGIVLVSGKPMCFTGLDENGFVSAKGAVRALDDIYVMSAAAFKLFEPKKVTE